MNYYVEEDEKFERDFNRFFFFLEIFVVVLFVSLFIYANDIYAAEVEENKDVYYTAEETIGLVHEKYPQFSDYNYAIILDFTITDGSPSVKINDDKDALTDGIYYVLTQSKAMHMGYNGNNYLYTSNINNFKRMYDSLVFQVDETGEIFYKDNLSVVYSASVALNLKFNNSKFTLLDTNYDILEWYDNSVFFSQKIQPIISKPITELEKTQQKIQQQIIPIVKPKLIKSLDSLVPLGIGLLACLIGLALLPRVFRKFRI